VTAVALLAPECAQDIPNIKIVMRLHWWVVLVRLSCDCCWGWDWQQYSLLPA